MRSAFFSLFLFFGYLLLMVRGDDLVTRDGTVYHDYKVLGHDAGYLTIMYSDGGGKIPLSNLPDDLQKQYGYNKQQADAFVQASIAQDRQDREAIAQQEEQHQQQIAAHAQATADVSAPASAPVAPAAVAVATPASPPASPSPPAADSTAAATAASASSSAAPASQEDIDAIKRKIKDVQEDMVGLQVGLKGAGSNDTGAYGEKLDNDRNYLGTLQIQLKQMELDQPRKKMTWDDVTAVHEQIVGLLDDMDSVRHDTNSGDYAAMLRCNNQVNDDQDQIDELRRTLAQSIKPPVTLSPDEVTALKQKMADLKADMDRFSHESAMQHGTEGTLGADHHQANEDAEQYAELSEQLLAVGNNGHDRY